MKKFIFALLVLLLTKACDVYSQKSFTPNLDKYSRVSFSVKMVGDALVSVREKSEGNSMPSAINILKELNKNNKDASVSENVQFIFTGATTIYDLVSNGTPYNISQNPSNPNHIHSALMCSPSNDPYGFPGRRTKYYYSTNIGSNWSLIVEVPSVRSGFPTISQFADGTEVIACYTNVGSGQAKPEFFLDAFEGLGSFMRLNNPSNLPYMYPRIVATNIALQNKIVALSCNSASPNDSLFYTIYQSPSFTPWAYIAPASLERYQISRGTDGRIGIVYIVSRTGNPVDYGSVFFMESANNGTTFSTPLKIFNANFNTDSLGAFKGISLAYQGNSPKVVFETVKQKTNGSYFPGAPANIRFWSTSLPGIDPNRSIIIADTSEVVWHPYISTGTSTDLFASVCRPTIGVSGGVVFVVFMVPSNLVGGTHDTCSFMDIWKTASGNGGLSWGSYSKLNPSSPVRDWTYPSLSPRNDTSASYYYANFIVLKDSVPGTYVNHQTNGPSNAMYYFVRIETSGIITNQPETPALISPLNGAANVSLTPAMSWTSTGNSYRLQISHDSIFTSNEIDTLTNATNLTIPDGILNLNSLYYWRVKAFISAGESNWTLPWHFTTSETGIHKISSDIPAENKLFANYPNPFNPVTIIKFQIKDSKYVVLKIFNILGKEVRTLVNKKLQAGKYEFDFDASHYTSGIFFLKIEAGDFVDVKKMIFLK